MSAQWWRNELHVRREGELHRALRILPPLALDLASNDYLGLAHHPEVLSAAKDAADQFGSGARASRLVSGHSEIHAKLERNLAAFKKCEAALVFPSGYHANLAVITSLARSGDAIFCDKANHASLIDGCFLASARGAKLRFYNSLEKLERLLRRDQSPSRLVVSDTVYSMDGTLAPLPDLLPVSRRYGATLVLDDAHGTGVLGARGSGALEHFEIAGAADIVQIGTLSKALVSQGGFVVGDTELIEWLVNTARPFIYTTGLNPAACGAALAALKLIEQAPERLEKLRAVKAILARGLTQLGFDVQENASPILPVMIGDAAAALELSSKLMDKNIWCPAIRPPTVPRGASRLRVTAKATLTEEEMARELRRLRSADND